MKLKQAKAVVWQHSDEGIVGENGLQANGLRIRSDIRAGDPIGYCIYGQRNDWVESRDTIIGQNEDGKITKHETRNCKSCTTFNPANGTNGTSQECGNWH